eukprot:6175567-Pleurochrysis_carterae.AAC.4
MHARSHACVSACTFVCPCEQVPAYALCMRECACVCVPAHDCVLRTRVRVCAYTSKNSHACVRVCSVACVYAKACERMRIACVYTAHARKDLLRTNPPAHKIACELPAHRPTCAQARLWAGPHAQELASAAHEPACSQGRLHMSPPAHEACAQARLLRIKSPPANERQRTSLPANALTCACMCNVRTPA